MNEAPNIALAAISSHEVDRGCGMFWSILCCIPSFGSSIGFCQDGNSCRPCCYPQPVNLESNAGLKALTETLNKIKNVSREDVNLSLEVKREIKSPQGKNKLIEWQVKQTINILQQAMDQDVIKGSYKTVIRDALTTIRTRADQEERFGKILDDEKLMITGTDVYVPKYGLTFRNT